jgi:membrane associated rhomboid family serine protease
MFPVGDEDHPKIGLQWLTVLLIGINVVVFLYQASLGESRLEQFIRTYGVVPAQIMQGQNLISLLTSMFMHGGWMHLFGNMLSLWIFGDNVEAVLGKPLYLVFYLLGGLAASAVHILFSLGSTTPSLGASGAIAAVMGAYVVMFPKARVRVIAGRSRRVTRVTALLFVGIWFALQFFNGVASLGVNTAQTGGVAYWAHIGGLVAGVVAGFLVRAVPPLDNKRETLVHNA